MTPPDLINVLTSVLTQASQVLHTPHGFVALVTPDREAVAFEMGTGDLDFLGHEGLGPCADVTEQVWRSGRPVVMDTDGPPEEASALAGARLRAVAVVPLRAGGRTAGVLGMAYDADADRTFGTAELEQLCGLCHLAAIALESARLYAQEKRSVALAERLQASAQAINQSLDLDVVLPAILDQLREVIDYDSSTIQLVDGPRMRVIAARGFAPDEIGRVRLLAEYPYNELLATCSEPIIEGPVPSTHLWRMEPHLSASRSNLGVPLVVRDRIIGALTVDSHKPNRYGADDARTAMAFGRHAAAAIEHARLLASERAARHHAERLRAATQALSSTIDLQEVFALILSELRKVVPYDSASVQQLTGQRLELIGGHGFRNLPNLIGLSFDVLAEDNPNREVVRTRAPVILTDAPASYPNFGTDPHREADIHSWLGVPLLFGDRLIGMLSVDSKQPGFYTAEHAGMALSFAAQAAIAIENARLFAAAQRELAERKEAQQRLNYLANFDPVTGLANRTLLGDRLGQALATARRENKLVGILFLDLDRFKMINDTLGHAAGDQLLKAVGQRLKHTVREGDTVARMGGDEFTLVLPQLDTVEDSERVAEKVSDAFARPFVIDGREVFVSTSIGVSLFPSDGADLEVLLSNADAAMYWAKGQGGNMHRFFTTDIVRAVERLDIESDMRHALDRSELLLHYQPLVNLCTGRVVGVESLMRWRHPRRGLVLPDDFVPLAEETGLIVPFGAWALGEACRQGMAWQLAGFAPLRVSVNVSARQLSANLVKTVKSALTDSGLKPSCLLLEITESILVQNPEAAISTLRELNALGVALAIDDFGVGYSSLSQLKRFPFDMLKIDQSFVRDIPDDSNDAAIVTAIIAMAHALGVSVVAEGVETTAQRALLKERGCDAIQGRLVCPPLTAAELAAAFFDHGPQ